jgi:hypothetical protein
MRGAWGLLALALAGACAAGKFADQVDVHGIRIREGMSSAQVAEAMGAPDFVSKTGHHFAWEFRKTGRTIEPAWEEWAWFDEDEIHTYVVYVSDGTVQRVGVITDSPPPPRGNGCFATFICR